MRPNDGASPAGRALVLPGADRGPLLSVLTEDSTFQGPVATLDSPTGYAGLVGEFGGWVQSRLLTIEADRVAHTFTYHMTEPSRTDIPSCDVFVLRDGKICASRAYNDTAEFPRPPS